MQLKEGAVAEQAKQAKLLVILKITLRLRDTRARAVRNVLGNLYLSSLTKNLWYEEREQLDSGGGGTLSQGAGHDGSFF